MQKYLSIAAVIAIVAALGYVGYLEWRVSDLKSDKAALEKSLAQAEADIEARDNQILVLGERETKLNQMEKHYAQSLQDLAKLQSGPVAPVLRYAIEHDRMR